MQWHSTCAVMDVLTLGHDVCLQHVTYWLSQALCEMFSVAGKKLEESSRSPARVEGYLKVRCDRMLTFLCIRREGRQGLPCPKAEHPASCLSCSICKATSGHIPTFKAMEKLTKTDGIAPRIRFLIRDVLDLRRMKWVPRRETLKVSLPEHERHQVHPNRGNASALATPLYGVLM
jgi:hypothetical protein